MDRVLLVSVRRHSSVVMFAATDRVNLIKARLLGESRITLTRQLIETSSDNSVCDFDSLCISGQITATASGINSEIQAELDAISQRLLEPTLVERAFIPFVAFAPRAWNISGSVSVVSGSVVLRSVESAPAQSGASLR